MHKKITKWLRCLECWRGKLISLNLIGFFSLCLLDLQLNRKAATAEIRSENLTFKWGIYTGIEDFFLLVLFKKSARKGTPFALG